MLKCVVVASEARKRVITESYISKFEKLNFVKSFPTLHHAAQLFKEHHVDFLFLHVPNIFFIAENSVLLAKLKQVGTRVVVISKNFSVIKYALPVATDYLRGPVTAMGLLSAIRKNEVLNGTVAAA